MQDLIVNDEKGRKLTLRRPPITTRFRLLKMLGPSQGENSAYVRDLYFLRFLHAIDGEPVAPFTTEREAEAILQRLDYEGNAALTDGVLRLLGIIDGEKAPEDDKLKKKLPPTTALDNALGS